MPVRRSIATRWATIAAVNSEGVRPWRRKAFWGVVAGGVAAAAVATTVAFAVPAAASTPGHAVAAGQAVAVTAASDPATSDKTPTCDQLKTRQQKRQAVITRLQADANTRGSVAWLNAKAAAATAAGNTAEATLYTDKAKLRGAVLAPLQTVAADIDAIIKANC